MKERIIRQIVQGALWGMLSLCVIGVGLELLCGRPIAPVWPFLLERFGLRVGLLWELLFFAFCGAGCNAMRLLYRTERVPPRCRTLLCSAWFVALVTILILHPLRHVSWETVLVLAGLTAGIWLLACSVNWLGSRQDAERIRKRLGLPEPEEGSGPFQVRTILPYLLIAAEMELALPPLLRLVDAPDFPVLTGLLYPYIVLPFACFYAGLAIGKRFGTALLYPVVCGLLTIPHIFWLYNSTALFHAWMAGGAALIGNLAGAAWKRYQKKK